MDQALIQVGLPVKCAWGDCDTRGFVKPHNYGGWIRRWHKKWYCPTHAKEAKEIYDSIIERYKTLEPKNDIEDLYKLLED